MSDIQDAIDGWRKCANDPIMYPQKAMRDICEQTAQALELERDTGVAVCPCCHKSGKDRTSCAQESGLQTDTQHPQAKT